MAHGLELNSVEEAEEYGDTLYELETVIDSMAQYFYRKPDMQLPQTLQDCLDSLEEMLSNTSDALNDAFGDQQDALEELRKIEEEQDV